MPAPPSCCHRTCSIWSKRCALGSSSWTVEKRWRMAPLPSWHREPTWLLPGRTSSRSSSRSPVTPLTSKNLEHVAKLNRDVVQAFRPACHGGPEGPHYIQFCNPLLGSHDDFDGRSRSQPLERPIERDVASDSTGSVDARPNSVTDGLVIDDCVIRRPPLNSRVAEAT